MLGAPGLATPAPAAPTAGGQPSGRSADDGEPGEGPVVDDAARLLIERAQAGIDHSEPVEGRELALRAEAAAVASGDRWAEARALTIVARAHHILAEYADGIEVALRAVRLWRERGDTGGESTVRTTIARILILTGDMAEALDEGLTALEMSDLSGELRPRMVALTAVGIVHLCLRQHDLAMEYCERAAETARMLGDVVAHGNLLDTIACVFLSMAYSAREEGDEVGAATYCASGIDRFRQAMEIARREGHRHYEMTALGNLAEGLAFAGRPEDALALMESWPTDPELDARSTITQHLDSRGCICVALGRYDEAIALFSEALELAPGRNTAMWYCEHLSDAHERAGDLRAALDYHKRFHGLFKQVASESAQRSASIAAIRLETLQAKEYALQERLRAEQLQNSNDELSQRAESLLKQSLEDPLTGLANRRFMDRLLDNDVQSYAIALIDVDHFKRVNDQHSHQVGDEVLRHLANVLRAASRATDTAVRYGGEEFALLFSHLSEASAAIAAERLRRLVEDFDWGQIEPGLRITVSVGVACGVEATSPVEVLALADARLYEAKHAGRNRVRCRRTDSGTTAPPA
jgi:diguanylate cyclase (GGDEF)-like protein